MYQNNPYDMASIRGKVVEQIKGSAVDHIDKLAEKIPGKRQISRVVRLEKKG
jgi:hypothetical protein